MTQIDQRSVFRVDDSDGFVGAIVESIAAHGGVEVTELPPLYDVIDPGILDASSESADGVARSYVRFQDCGYELTAHADGSILVDE